MTEMLNEEKFETAVLKSQKPVLLDFSASWCAPCRALSPVIDQLGAEFADRAGVFKLDVDEAPRVADRFRIKSIPCVVFFQGGKEVGRVNGLASKAKLSAMLEAIIAP